MGELHHYNGSSWSTDSPIKAMYYYNGTSWVEVQVLHHYDGTSWYEAVNFAQYRTITEYVSNVDLKKGTELFGLSEHECTWTAPTSWPEDGYNYVEVRWYVNTSLDTTENIDPANGITKRDYNVEDDIYCNVRYKNVVGFGPNTQTSTI